MTAGMVGGPPAGSNAGATNNATNTARPPAAPPNPKQQAVTFALELAKIRAGLPGSVTDRATDVDLLIEDAKAIAAFIGQAAPTRELRIPGDWNPNAGSFGKPGSA